MKNAILLFLVFPLIAFWLIGSAALNHQSRLQVATAKAELNLKAEEILNHLEPVNFLQNLFSSFINELKQKEISSSRLNQLIEKYHNSQVNFIPYVIVKGQMITPTSLTKLYDLPVLNVWQHMHRYREERFLKIKTKVRSSLGPLFSFSHLKKLPDTAVEFSGKSGKGIIYYHFEDKDNGALLIAWQMPDPKTLAKFLPDHLKKDFKISIIPLIDGHRTSSPELTFQKESGLSATRTFNGFNIIIEKEFSTAKPARNKAIFKIAMLILTLLFLAFMRFSITSQPLAGLSIKLKLIGLALYVILLPLLGLSYFGWKLFTERESLLRQEAVNACLDSINIVDSGFDRKIEDYQRFYRSFIEQFRTTMPVSDLFEHYKDIEKQRQMNWIEVRDLNAEIVVTTQDASTTEDIGVVGKTFARHGITNYLGHRLNPEKELSPSASEVMIQEFLESPLGGWAQVFESPDEISQITFGGYDLLWYWNVFPDDIASAAFIVCDNHLHWAIENYLEQTLIRRVAHEKAALRMLAWSENNSMTIPGNEALTGEIGNFLTQIRRNSQPQITRLVWQGKSWLAAGAHGKRLRKHILLSLYPLEIIEDQITTLKKDIGWSIIFALFLAVLTGMLFSYTLLQPVAELMRGVKAIQKRDISQKIEVLQNDELGKLSESFNQTIDTLADIIYAKKIQEQIIPSIPPEIEGWQTAICYLPAAELGGDYCDIQVIDEQHFLVAIGEASGHGVSSALVTAMVKALTSEFSRQKELDPAKILGVINDMLYQQFACKNSMTMFFGIFNRLTGRVTAINAAHSLPFRLLRKNCHQVKEIQAQALGLSSEMKDPANFRFAMEIDEILILYSATFLKFCAQEGDHSGSDGFKEICLKYADLSPDCMSRAIISEIQTQAREEIDVDLTLLIIKRCVGTKEIEIESTCAES